MTLWRPPQIPYLSDFILGHWPDGDEDAMRRAAKHWSAMADALGALQDPADQAMAEALAAIDGQANEALTSYWQEISGGDGSDIAQLKKNCESFAEQLEHGATDIEHAKLVIYITGVSLLASLAWALIPGVGQAAEAGAIVAAKAAVTKATQQLMSKLVAKGAVFLGERVAGVAVKVGVGAVVGTAFGAGTDAAAQGIELAEGHREDGFDWSSTGTAAAAGAVGGAVAAPVSHFVGDKIGDRVTSAVARDTDVPGVAANWAGRSVSDIPSDLAANAAGQVATGQPLTVDSLLEGAGGGLATHPGRQGPAAPGVDTTAQPADGDTSQPTTAAEPPASTGPGTPSDTTPVQSVAAPPPETQSPNAAATPASTTPSSVAPPTDGAGPAATVAAGHQETAVAPNDSTGQGQTAETRSPAPEQRPVSAAPGTSDSGSPAASAPGASPTDRAAAPPPSAAASATAADRPTPVGRPTDAGPQPSNSVGQQNRAPEVARSPGVETSDRRPSDAAPATGAARPEAAAAPRSSASADVPARTDASQRPRGDSSPHQGPPVAADQPRRDGHARRDNAENGGRGPTDRARGDDSGPVRGLSEDSRNRDRGEVPVRERHDEPGPRAGDREGRPDRRSDGREDRPAGYDGRRTHPGEEGNQPSVAGRGRDSGLNSSGRSSEARGDRLVGDDHADRERTGDADAAAQSPTSPSDRMHHPGEVGGSDAPAAVPDVHTGGAIRPRDDFAAFEWAEDAYERFRGDDRDIDDIARVLAQHPRADGSNFSRDDIRRIKDHLFREEHPIRDYDGDVVHRRYDADPGIAEAWIRLRSDRPDPADLVLLEHELTEANYYRDHPGSLYQDAHAHANIDHNWSEVAAGRSGERYDTLWGPDNGTTDLLQPNREQPGRGDVPVRGDQGPPGPHPDDRQGEQRPPYGPTGGRDFPVGRRPDPDAGQTREPVAGERSHRFLTEDAAPPDIAGLRRWFSRSDDDSNQRAERRGSSEWNPAFDEDNAAIGVRPDGRLPVESQPYYANPRFHDPDAAARYVGANPHLMSEVRDIRARENSYPELGRLTNADIAVIRANQFAHLNEQVNRATRDGDTRALVEHDTAIRALVSAYNDLPNYRGTVVRQISITDPAKLQNFLAAYSEGNTPTDPGFASSDKEASMGGNIEMIIESRAGKDISWASSQQDEIVFPPGHRFYVESRVFDHDKNKYVIRLTDLGRNSDGHHPGRDARDSAASPRTNHDEREHVSGGTRSDGARPGVVGRARQEGAPGGHRGPEEDLAAVGRFGATPNREGGRGSHLDPYSAAPQPPSYRSTGSPARYGQAPDSSVPVTEGPSSAWRAPEANPSPPSFPRESTMLNRQAAGPGPGLSRNQTAPSYPAGPRAPRDHDVPPAESPQPLPRHGPVSASDRQPQSPGAPAPRSVPDRPHAPSPPPPIRTDAPAAPRVEPPARPAGEPPTAPRVAAPLGPGEPGRPHQGRTPVPNHEPPAPDENGSPSRPPFTVRRSEADSQEPTSTLVVQVYLDQQPGVSNEQMVGVAQSAWEAAARIAGPGQRLPWGHRAQLEVQFINDPAQADIRAVVDHSGRVDSGVWSTASTPDALARHIREQLSLPADHDGRIALDANDIHRLSEQIAELNTDAPLRGLQDTREIGPGRLAPLENPAYQEYVRNALREGDHYTTWFDPRTHEAGRLINDGGPEVPGRRNSCGDNVMAGLSSFYGDPQISQPRHQDVLPDGSIDRSGAEVGVIGRISSWLGGEWQSFGRQDAVRGFDELHDLIHSLGPGSSAAVAVGFHARDSATGEPLHHPDGRPLIEEGHGVLVVYPRDADGPVWWDPLTSQTSDRPFPHLVADAASLHAIPLTQDARPYVAPTHSDGRAGDGVRRPGPREQPRVSDVPVRPGVGDVPTTVRGGDRAGTAHRADENGSRRPDRSDHRIPEPSRPGGSPDVHHSNPGGHPDARRPDIPAADPRPHDPRAGQPGQHRVPDTTRIDDRPATDRGLSDRDRQGHPGSAAARHREHDRGVVDRSLPAPGRGLAQPDGHGVLAEGQDLPPVERRDSEPPETNDHDHPGAERPDRSGGNDEPHARPDEPAPNLGDLFPPDGVPLDEGRVLPQLQRAVSGEYGGLHVVVESVNGSSDTLHVGMKVYDANGNEVGNATRSYYNAEGRILADHTMFRLEPHVRGQGCASQLNERMFQWYRQSGVDQVMLRANIDVGSYAWARQGFEFANQQAAVRDILPRLNREISKMRAEIEQLASEQVHADDPQRQRRIDELTDLEQRASGIVRRFRVGAANFPTPKEIALLGRPDGISPGESRDLSWPGKRVFMEPGVKISWHGVKSMVEEDR